MKINPAIFVIAMILCSGMNCKWNAKDISSGDGANQADETHGDSAGFENQFREYESEDRVIWQKPDLVIELLGNVEGKVIADIGAGTGYFSRRIAYKGAQVIAVDIDPGAIQWMEEQKSRFPPELRDRLIIRLAEPDDPKLNPDEVNMVLLVNTYSYIRDRVTYFNHLKTAIRSGGQVVIIDFKKKETPFGPPQEERLDVNEVVRELQAAGYSIVNVDEQSLDYQYIIKARSD